MANSYHWKPRWSEYPGGIAGEYLYSHQFKWAEPFRGNWVLVIGGGNSARACAVETSRISGRAEISWRRGYWVVPKCVLGKLTDVLARGSTRGF
jgi:cation diffusion facilitator CzcD-associated flavoprotein CzcO